MQNSAYVNRSREIADALLRHGLGYVVGMVGLERFVPFQRGLFGHPPREEPYTQPEHIRMALEDMGATFIKLGQILSTRADLLPPAYQRELARLQDGTPAMPFEAIRAVIETELGQPLGTLFAAFEPTPIAAASIGQAYAATLPDGTKVIVKVQRPGIAARVTADIAILKGLAGSASRRWELAEQYDLNALVREFAETLGDELDYLQEARHLERFAANFAGDHNIHIPRVFRDRTTPRVITLEHIHGFKVTDIHALDTAHINRSALAQRATNAILKMIFDDGFFHADPHPGNLFVELDGRIGLIDFGMVGILDAQTQDRLAALIVAVVTSNYEHLTDALLDLGFARQHVDRARLQIDVTQVLHHYSGQSLGGIAIGPLLEEIFATIRRHHMLLPPNLALLLKTLIMSEGMGAQLDPDFHLTTVLKPYAERLVMRQYSPLRIASQLRHTSSEVARLGIDAPRLLRQLLQTVERGGVQVVLASENVEPVLRRLDRLAHRIVIGMVTSAFIIGLAVLMTVYLPFGAEEWLAVFFTMGLLAVAILGTLIISWLVRARR